MRRSAEALPELLAPAGSPDALAAAIEGGADALTDPWGEPLRYEKKGKGGRFNIYSNGPDGEQGGDDDLSAFEDRR